jgi:hypothetical protein
MASKKILIQVILDDKASVSNKKLGSSLGKTTGEFKKMTAEQEKQYIAQQKNIISNKLYTDSLKQQALSQVDVADATGNARAQSGLNNAILLETGRLASDASYGFTAMANNLGQIVSLFGSFIKTNDGVVASFKQLIGSLWGTGGLLIGIQLLISFGPKIVKFFNELIGRSTLLAETFEDVSSHLGETTGKFELYIRTLQDATKGEQEQLDAIYALNEEFPEYIEKLEKAGLTIEDVKNKTKAATDINKAQREEIKKLAMSRAAQAKIEEESGKLIQLSIDEEIDKRNLLSEIEKKEEEIKNKQLKIDEFNAKEKQGKLFKDAKIERAVLKGQIGAIEEVVKRKKESYNADVANLVEKNDKERKAIQKNIDELLKFTDIATEVTERTVVSTQEILTQGVEQNEEYLERFRQIMAGEALEAGLEQRDASLAEFGEKYKKRIEDITRYEETEAKARIAIKKNYADAVSSISKGLKALGSLDDGFKIAAIITEKAEAISKVIIKTRETNTVISAVGKMKSALGFIGAEIQAKRRVLKNNINAGINIAGIVAAAAGGINAIKSKSSLGASLGGGAQGGEEPAEVQAPDFNVVGAGGVSQLATTLAGVTGQPLKAFVVSKEISSAQELERNITTTASIG